MITGQGNLSLKKTDLANQKTAAAGVKRTVFSHKATAGQTGISLSSLTAPTEMTAIGFTNPSVSELSGLNLLFNRNNLTLISSARGILMDYISYGVASSTQIDFKGFTALEGEIFTGVIQTLAQGSRVVDAAPIISTGTLTAGSTDYNAGPAWELGKYPAQQVGAVLLFVDGAQQFRNSGNQASPADGNYYEVSAGAGLSAVIRFNTAELYDRNILVVSNGLLAERPDGSMLQIIESVNGKLNNIALYVAALSGQSTTTVLGSPATNVDLKTFGDKVTTAETNIAALTVRDNAQESPTLQSDIIATRLGQKAYLHGTTYNGGIAPTITLSSGGGTLSSVPLGEFIPYQMQDSTWRMRFSINVILSNVARTTAALAIAGVTFFNTGAGTDGQVISSEIASTTANYNNLAIKSTGTIQTSHASVGTTQYMFSGDIKLASKPTWAY